MNPYNTGDYRRLKDSVLISFKAMEGFRSKRQKLIKSFTGSEYGGSKEVKTKYLNLLELAVKIYTRQLAVRAPLAKITTPYESLRPMAFNFELACKEAARETNLGVLLRRAAEDSLFSPLHVVKLGLEYMGKEKYNETEIDITRPYATNVSYDDLIWDMTARSAYKPSYQGDMYWITAERFKEVYNRSLPDKSDKSGDSSMSGMGERSGEYRAEDISHNENMDGKGKLDNMVGLQDIWLPNQQALMTCYIDRPSEKPLQVIDEFDGPDKGPYRSIWYTGVPDNAMPLAPFGSVKGLDLVVNNILRRLIYQAENKKNVTVFQKVEDAQAFKNTRDGHAMVGRGRKPEEAGSGGIDQPSMALMIQLKDMYSWATGNLDALGGLSPMSDTAKQDQMLLSSASAQIRDMQDAFTIFARDIFEYIAWAEYTEPVRTRVLEKSIPGTSMTIPVNWTPETREDDFNKLNFDINPISMRDELPEKKLADIENVLNRIVAPVMPMLEQQNMTIDVQKLINIAADKINVPELNDIVVPISQVGGPGAQPTDSPSPQLSSKPNETKRTYIRESRSTATRSGKDAALQQTLLNGNQQAQQQAAVFKESS